MGQAVVTRGGEHADLAHRAAEHAPIANCTVDQLTRAGQHRTRRCAKAFGECHHHQIKRRAQRGGGDARLHRGVPQARAVEIGGELARARRRTRGLDLRQRPNDAAVAVVRVLDLQQGCGGQRHTCVVARLGVAAHIVGSKETIDADFGELHTRIRGRAAGFVPHRVCFGADQHIVPRARQHAQRDLIGHRAGGQPERRFLAEQAGDARFKGIERWVVTVLHVAHWRLRHHGTHGIGGTGDSVGAQVDQHGR